MNLAGLLLPALFFAGTDTRQDESVARAYSLIVRLQRQLDPAEAHELSSLALEIAERESANGNFQPVFHHLAFAISFERNLSLLPRKDREPSIWLCALYEGWGAALTHLGEFELALAAFDFSLEELGKIPETKEPLFPPDRALRDLSQQALLLSVRKADSLRVAGAPDRGLSLLEPMPESEAFRSLDHSARAFYHSIRGNCLEDLGRFEFALDSYEKARFFWAAVGAPKREAFERKTLGDTLRKMGRPAAALEQYRYAQALASGVTFSPLEQHEFYADEGIALLDLGRKDEALGSLRRSLDFLDQWRKGLGLGKTQAPRGLSFSTVSRALGAWVRLRFDKEDQNCAQETFEQVDRLRASGLLSNWSAPSKSTGDLEDLEKQRSRLRSQIESKASVGQEKESVRRDLSDLDQRILFQQLQNALPAPKGDEPFVQESVPPGVVILEYLFAPEDVFLWVFAKGSWQIFSLGSGAEVSAFAKEVKEFSEEISHSPSAKQVGTEGRSVALARRLFPQEARQIVHEAASLWYVPDGPMASLPLVALGFVFDGGLAPISTLPSARFGIHLSKGPKTFEERKISIFANSKIQIGDFDLLRFSEEEALSIASLFSSGEARLFLGPDCSESKLKTLAGASGSILHVSAHGIFSPALSGGAALLLSPGNGEDGWLWASEIAPLSFPGWMIVLSSCHSAAGEWIPQEGLSGISRAFLAAGGRTVVGSLWAVDQLSTTLLMKAFYAALTRGECASRALRIAQEELRRDSKFADPYFWAAFRVEGDGEFRLATMNSPGSSSKFPSWIFYVGGALVVLIVFLVVTRRA